MYCTEKQGTGTRALCDWVLSLFLSGSVRSVRRVEEKRGRSIFLQQQLSNTVCVECEAVRERVQLFNFSKKIDRNIEIFKIFVLQKNVRIVEN